MKKIIFALMMMASVFAFTACSSDDDKGGPNCLQLIQNVLDAYEAYEQDPSEANQQALEAAETALENSNCEDEIDFEVE